MPAERVDKLPKPWAKLQRAEARALMAVEARTLVASKRTIKVVADAAAIEIASRDDRRHAEILAILLLASRTMRRRLAVTLVDGRHRARMTAIGRLRSELTLAGIGFAIGHAIAPRKDVDSAHADTAAASYASAWASAAVFLASEAERAGKSAAGAVSKAVEAKASALDRIVATEIPRTYNDQHRADAAELALKHPDLFADVVERWDAMLDACERCWSHDGETTPIGDSFSGGDEPGYMHPRCRCLRTLYSNAEISQIAA
jgi:hypothetical protein